MVKFFHFPVPFLGTKKNESESKQESMWTFFSENCNKIIVLLWLAMPFSKSSLHQKHKCDAVTSLPLNWKYQPQIHNFSLQVNHKWSPNHNIPPPKFNSSPLKSYQNPTGIRLVNINHPFFFAVPNCSTSTRGEHFSTSQTITGDFWRSSCTCSSPRVEWKGIHVTRVWTKKSPPSTTARGKHR